MPEKKDPYSSPAMKVLRLYILLLFSGRKYSLAELARKFDCSKQTILRMIGQTIAQTTALLPDFNQRSEALTSFARHHAKGSIDYSRPPADRRFFPGS